MSEQWRSINPSELKQKLKDLDSPWWFAGGYAIDLWLGRNTRSHGDIDITLFRENFEDLYFLNSTFEFYVASKNGLRHLKTISDFKKSDWNVWVKNIGEKEWLFQCLISDEQSGMWFYRRNKNIIRPKKEFGLALDSGEMIIAPEIQLLFKSRLLDKKDEIDFNNCISDLTKVQKIWLCKSLLTINTNHPWVDKLK